MKLRSLLLATFLSGSALTAASGPAAPAAEPKSKIEDRKSKTPKPYPLDVCLVTDNDLGSMGEETSMVYEGRTLKFCCEPCEKKFLKNPGKYLPKLDAEAAKPGTEPKK